MNGCALSLVSVLKTRVVPADYRRGQAGIERGTAGSETVGPGDHEYHGEDE